MTVVVTVERLEEQEAPAGMPPSSTTTVIVVVPGAVHMKVVASNGPTPSSELVPKALVTPRTPMLAPLTGAWLHV
jgi:hypothetical protein